MLTHQFYFTQVPHRGSSDNIVAADIGRDADRGEGVSALTEERN